MTDHVELIARALRTEYPMVIAIADPLAKAVLGALDAAGLMIVTVSLVEYAHKQSQQHVNMMDRLEKEHEVELAAARREGME